MHFIFVSRILWCGLYLVYHIIVDSLSAAINILGIHLSILIEIYMTYVSTTTRSCESIKSFNSRFRFRYVRLQAV